MADMKSLIAWLQDGISHGHLTADAAFQWLNDLTGPTKNVSPKETAKRKAPPFGEIAAGGPHSSGVRLKKDGTPWGKPGRKPKEQPELNGV